MPINYYDIERIYDEMEQYLINNIKRNLMGDLSSFHLKEEKKLGFDWEAWQATKLRELKRYRRENKNILHKYLKNVDSDVAEVLRQEYSQGKKSAYNSFKKALKKGLKSNVKVKDSWFRLNDRKLNALIKAVNNDFKKANNAVLRKTNDTYRQVIFEASMYNNTGVMTGEEAIRKAIGNFERRGINSIVYSNGSKHRISEYARMAIRTSGTRAYLQGNGEFRKRLKQPLVKVSKHGTACKICQQFEGKILIDDVYSGGTKEDGNYMLMSTAMKQGFYHPNCRHALGTYYPELEEKDNDVIAKEVEKEESAKIKVSKTPLKKHNYKDVDEEMIEQMQNDSFMSYQNMTTEEHLDINKYTSSDGYYQDVTRSLINHKGNLEDMFDDDKQIIKSLDNIMNSNRITDDIVAYRGTVLEFYENYNIGDEFTMYNFPSTTLKKEKADIFTFGVEVTTGKKPLLIKINVPEGTKALYIGENTYASHNEYELLLNRSLKYKVISFDKTKKVAEMVLEVIK